MSLEELISIERIEFEISRERVQETYVIVTFKNKLDKFKNKLEKLLTMLLV